MNAILKELAKRMRSRRLFWMVLGMLATSIGMLGGFPQPPQIFLSTIEQYPMLQWGLVYVLVFQGMGGGDKYWSAIGVGATFLLYKVMGFVENRYEGFKSSGGTVSDKCPECPECPECPVCGPAHVIESDEVYSENAAAVPPTDEDDSANVVEETWRNW